MRYQWLLLTALAFQLDAQEPVRYELSFPNAAHHEMQVRATFPDVKQRVVEVRMSRSSPGRYALCSAFRSAFRPSYACGVHRMSVSYTHLTLPTNREV